MLDGNLVVAVVDLDEHGARLDELAFLDVDLDHVSSDTGADGIDVAIDFGVIGISRTCGSATRKARLR